MTGAGGTALDGAEASALDGRNLGLAWCLPLAGLLLSIALLPLLAPGFWHRHHGKVAAAWTAALLVPLAARYGLPAMAEEAVRVLLREYLPFVILLLALFTIAGGVRLTGGFTGSPASNTALLAIGTALASFVGTTGAAVLLIRPLIAANEARTRRTHVFVFFIFLVCNIGGALSPLGDPPLFLGFLAGIDFFWPAVHLLLPTLTMAGALLALFFLVDRRLFRREAVALHGRTAAPLALEGKGSLALLAVAVAAVLASGVWHPGIALPVLGTRLALESVLRDLLLVAAALASLGLGRGRIHAANGFSWFPILEVAKLFAGLFLTVIPVLAILGAGREGALAPVLRLIGGPDGKPVAAVYFWLAGGLSSVLDNAPTYLVFFHAAGGDPPTLMGPLAGALAAISAGAVFMGANTYVGNAPNFMVRSVCETRGIRMPSFFGFMVWSLGILGPLYLLLALLFFRF